MRRIDVDSSFWLAPSTPSSNAKHGSVSHLLHHHVNTSFLLFSPDSANKSELKPGEVSDWLQSTSVSFGSCSPHACKQPLVAVPQLLREHIDFQPHLSLEHRHGGGYTDVTHTNSVVPMRRHSRRSTSHAYVLGPSCHENQIRSPLLSVKKEVFSERINAERL